MAGRKQPHPFLILCPACNSTYLPPRTSAPPVQPAKRGRRTPSSANPRLFHVRCGACPGQPTIVVPDPPSTGPTSLPVRMTREALCPFGTRPGAWVYSPPLPAPLTGPAWTAMDYLANSYRLQFPEKYRDHGLGRFPLRPVLDQLGFAVRIGLSLKTAVLATIASEWSYIARLPPGTGQLEALLGTLCAVVLPPLARPAGPAWLYTSVGGDVREGCVSFSAQRQAYLWARARKRGGQDQPAAMKRLRLAYSARALPFADLLPGITANLRVLRLSDYRLKYGFVRFASRSFGLLCWDTCTGGLRIDEAEHWRWHEAMEGVYGRQMEI